MNWRKHGFTQRKPKEPGVYFVAGDLLKPLAPPESLRQGWDVARVMFWAGSYTNAHDNRESAAHWRIATLDGVDYAWKPGMWLKGPISPLQPNYCSAAKNDIAPPPNPPPKPRNYAE